MPQIRCRYVDCIFLDDGYCSARGVEIDPDEGCLTFTLADETSMDKDWDDDLEKMWDVEDLSLQVDDDDEDDELWLEVDD